MGGSSADSEMDNLKPLGLGFCQNDLVSPLRKTYKKFLKEENY